MALSSLPSSVAASVGRSVASSVASSSFGTTLRWGATHGLMRAAIRRQVRAGNPDARLLLDPVMQADPFPHYETLRSSYPFAPGAFARLTVHHDVSTAVLRSDDFGVTHPTQVVPAPARAALALAGPPRNPGPIEPPSMLAVDAPDHPRYRKLVSRAFTARRVAALRERTTEVAQELLDDMDRAARDGDGHTVDLVAHYASLLPVTVISEMLGVPTSMREQFLSWGDGAATSLDMGLTRRAHAQHGGQPRGAERLDARAPAPAAARARGRPALEPRRRGRRRRRGPVRAGAGVHRAARARRRVRDDGEPHRQRHRAALRPPRAARTARRGARPVAERRRRDPALRPARRAHRAPGRSATPRSPARPWPRATSW